MAFYDQHLSGELSSRLINDSGQLQNLVQFVSQNALQAGVRIAGGLAAYFACKPNYSETTCRTVAIETSMKSSAFGFLLAKLHFGMFLVRVPSAVSVVWMALVGSSMAVAFRFLPAPADE